jgi:hypothetical protein
VGSDAGADRPQQERWQVRMIGRLRVGITLGAPRFGAADRGHARRLCRAWWREGRGRCFRLCACMAAGASGVARLTLAALVATPGGARLAFAARVAAAARTFP